jgi:hypothetical protein
MADDFTIELKPTSRGFLRGDFKDRYDNECSIQESSIATEPCIWLGCNEGEHHHVTGECMARMHLTPEMAAALIPLLQRFVAGGDLRNPRRPRQR